MLAVYTLWRREVVRFLRQRSRIVGALGSPLVFWFLIGSGLNRSFQGGPSMPLAGGYLEYFYPGTLALIVLFTAIFATISIVEDRQEGFLQGVLVAPVPRVAIVAGKVLGSTTLAVLQGALFLLLAPFAHVELHLADLPGLFGVMLLVALGLSGLGFLVAWWLDSAQGFHAVMNVFLIPMWILSGALFPSAGAAGWVRALMLANPLTYGVSALRGFFYDRPLSGEPPFWLSLLIVTLFAVAMAVAGKVLGSTTLAVLQGTLFLVLAPLAQVRFHLADLPFLLAVMALVAFGLSGLGFLVAWWLDSAQGFHAIMNVFLIPMWILSGALFPAAGAAGWVRVLMLVNPLTYGVSALRWFFYDQPLPGEPPLAVSLTVVVAFAVAMAAAGTLAVRRKGSR
jgi:ABC-2 type transport system permease protein